LINLEENEGRAEFVSAIFAAIFSNFYQFLLSIGPQTVAPSSNALQYCAVLEGALISLITPGRHGSFHLWMHVWVAGKTM